MTEASLAVVSTDMEAEMLCGELRANGIECSYRKIGPGANLGTYAMLGQAGPSEVLVDESQLEEARKLLPDNQ
jgi:hypothetical protein